MIERDRERSGSDLRGVIQSPPLRWCLMNDLPNGSKPLRFQWIAIFEPHLIREVRSRVLRRIT